MLPVLSGAHSKRRSAVGPYLSESCSALGPFDLEDSKVTMVSRDTR